MIEICFVCTGNTCRSVMAERIAKKMAKERKLKDIKFSSCGVNAKKENISDNSKKILKELGYDSRDRKSVKLKKLKPSVIYIAMNSILKKYLGKKCISCQELFEDVPDPYGQSEDVYKMTAKLIEQNVEVLLNKIENMRGEK